MSRKDATAWVVSVCSGILREFQEATYRSDGAVTTHLVIRWKTGLPQDKDQPWYLATSLPLDNKTTNRRISDLYKLRFDIEELFRDAKNEHLGWSLAKTRITRADRLDRLILVAALAYVLLVAAGLWCRKHLDPRLWCTNHRKRELSAIAIAIAIARVMLDRIRQPWRPPVEALLANLATTEGNWGCVSLAHLFHTPPNTAHRVVSRFSSPRSSLGHLHGLPVQRIADPDSGASHAGTKCGRTRRRERLRPQAFRRSQRTWHRAGCEIRSQLRETTSSSGARGHRTFRVCMGAGVCRSPQITTAPVDCRGCVDRLAYYRRFVARGFATGGHRGGLGGCSGLSGCPELSDVDERLCDEIGCEAGEGLFELLGRFVRAGFDFAADAIDEVLADIGEAFELASHLRGGGEVRLIAAACCGGRGRR